MYNSSSYGRRFDIDWAFVGLMSLLVGVFGALGVALYLDHGPVSGTVISTNYDPRHKYYVMVGKVTVPRYKEQWTANLDLDDDGQGDRNVVISEDVYNDLEAGDTFTR